MNSNIIVTLKDYFQRGGFHIFLSTLISNIIGIVLTILIVRILTPAEYGEVTFVQSYIMILIPFAGLGLNYSYLRYASTFNDPMKQMSLFKFCLKYGFVSSIFLAVLAALIGIFLDFKVVSNQFYIIIFSLYIITFFLKEICQSYLRINHKNIEFAKTNILFSILSLSLGLVATYLLKGYGYIFSRVLIPLIIFFIIIWKEGLNNNKISVNDNIKIKELINYGFFVGLGSMASQMMLHVDTLSLGFMELSTETIATYKVATQIPMIINFLPAVIFTTDFVMIAEKYLDKKFLRNYRKKTMFILFMFSAALSLVTFYFGEWIITIMFGRQYIGALNVLKILMLGAIANFTLISPNGNILSAVGKSHLNAMISYIGLGMNVILNWIFIHYWGWHGAAISTSLVNLIVGSISFILCNKYISNLKDT